MSEYYGKSDIGKRRSSNQDAYRIIGLPDGISLLAAVCDGMGGASGGIEASTTAIDEFCTSVEEKYKNAAIDGDIGITGDAIVRCLQDAVKRANERVHSMSVENPALAGMGTTVTAVLISENTIYSLNVGDSRTYIAKNGELKQLTHDHSYVQMLVDMGRLTAEEAKVAPNRNIITRAIGIEDRVEADIVTEERSDSVLLLCSDGLSGPLGEDEICRVLSSDISAEEMANTLIDKANEISGSDNITAAVIKITSSED